MLQDWQGRLQELWVRSPRNRIIIMISTGVVTILVLCGLCNVIGSLMSNVVASALTSNPGPKPTTGANSSQINNFNPTFPLPSPTTYPVPNQGATPVGSSDTPAPSPTKDPRATPTDQPTQPGGGGKVHYVLSPDPTGKNFVAGQPNQVLLSGGQPGDQVQVSIYFTGSTCIIGVAPNDPVTLDATGNGTFSCTIPANLKGSTASLVIHANGGPNQQYSNIPIN